MTPGFDTSVLTFDILSVYPLAGWRLHLQAISCHHIPEVNIRVESKDDANILRTHF